jgi:phosphoribosylformylglycinamidine synthase
MATPRVLVLRAPGTNCDLETALAWQLAGAAVTTLPIAPLLEAPHSLDQFEILSLPGGFSYGDDLGAGQILATRLQGVLAEPLQRLLDRGGLVIGICNGFQVLVRAGLLPGRGVRATLARNHHGRFECRWVHLAITPGKTPFLASDEPIYLPVAHGEGRFLTADACALDDIVAAGQAVARYADSDGRPTQEFPANPNGSAAAIAGLSDPSGQVFGLMPHPERYLHRIQHPRWTRGAGSEPGDGMRIFTNAVSALR